MPAEVPAEVPADARADEARAEARMQARMEAPVGAPVEAAARNGSAVREPAPPLRRGPDPAGAPLPRRDGLPAPWRTAPSELPPAPACPDSTLERIRDALEAMR
jgi:hypothetical protein